MKQSKKTNTYLAELITELRVLSHKSNANIWKRLAKELEKPTRQRRKVNLYHIDKYAENGDTVIVPGKVLATGDLKKKIKVAAWQFSEKARTKVKELVTIQEIMKENPKGRNLKLIG